MQDRRYYDYGDIYDTIGACDDLETHLSRLKRQRVLDETAWRETREAVETVREQLERRLEAVNA